MPVAATTTFQPVEMQTRRLGVSAPDQLECESMMSSSARDHATMKVGKELLAAHPERYLKVDTSALNPTPHSTARWRGSEPLS